jgi:glucose-1-phosphate thymidylyltransferase
MDLRGVVCAGGAATRLGELTRVANKHLLPVGGWPMIYYPLQLLQLAGIREVLIVTGKGHAGQMIDLLGDGRLEERGTGAPLLDLDLTYKVQTEPGGIAQVVGMARDFAAGDGIVVVLGDNLFEFAQSDALQSWVASPDDALIFV